MPRESELWYRNPARTWTEALPLGNGRLGAMVFGGITTERIQLNEESVWSGGFRNRDNPDAKEHLEQIRSLLTRGNINEAENLARYTLSGTPEFQRSYQTLGDLYISFHDIPLEVREYKRNLDLDEAVSLTRYEAGGYLYEREVFASSPADVIVIRLKTTNPEGMTFDARLVRDRFCDNSGKINDSTIYFNGVNGGDAGISFCCVMTGNAEKGSVKVKGEYLVFRNATEAYLYITAATNFRVSDPAIHCRQILRAAKSKAFGKIRHEHVKDYKQYETRMSFTLGESEKSVNLATDERLELYKEDSSDLGLIELYFRFGRYLLISCSRPGTLPANLQGIWCDDFKPPWDSKYTININTQMNYWPAESCNLSDCHLPLFDHIKRMRENGVETARVMYGARGFVAHHNTDIWGDTAPQDTYIPASYWVMGAAWLCLHIWEHYQYTLDKSFLDEYFYLIKEACVFFIDYLIPNEKGEMIASPTVSPENTYILANGKSGRLSAGCAMDTQILDELLTACVNACHVLDREPELANELRLLREKLPPSRVNSYGGIQEWLEDYDEEEPGHRHISHLFALFPGSGISPENTPELAAAARKTLDRRLIHGGGHTGWSRAWITNFWARLGDRQKASENIDLLLSKSTLPNLFDNHPPFQIDGNFGGIAAIANVLLQSEPDRVILLKALPDKWDKGHVTGLRAKGGLSVDIKWENGKLKTVEMKATHDYVGTVLYNESQIMLNFKKGQTARIGEHLTSLVITD